MKKLITFLTLSVLFLAACQTNQKQDTVHEKPNIIIIYLDDLGYVIRVPYGGTGVKTPNIDKLADNGMRFTTAYSSSATCTPSRYALLTGEYPWRNQSARILPGSAPLIIDIEKMTIPRMLKEQGYNTGIVGKWHLGLGLKNLDWNGHISPGPSELGFDYSFIMAATVDRTPTVYIENGYVAGLDLDDPLYVNYEKNFEGEPTGLDNPELLKMRWHHGHNNSVHNGIPRIGFQKGGKSALWTDEDMADEFLEKAQDFIKKQKSNPFFLYYAMHQPHVPRTPHPRFVGTSEMGPRGDVIAEADWCVGELIKTLEKESILDNTLIVFSSDNGPVVNDGYYDDAVEKLGSHKPWGPLRGGKYSLFEAGTRVPFIVYWKGEIKPAVTDVMFSQIDLFSSLAKLAGSKERGPDSEELLDVLLGKSSNGREILVTEATSRTALRKENWSMIPPYKGPARNEMVNIELGNSPEFQLYNLSEDIGQQNNLTKENPEKLKEMIEVFQNKRGVNFDNIEQLELK